MFWNNDEEFDDTPFNEDGADDETMEEIRRERDRINTLPVMLKARAIFELVRALVETFPIMTTWLRITARLCCVMPVPSVLKLPVPKAVIFILCGWKMRCR